MTWVNDVAQASRIKRNETNRDKSNASPFNRPLSYFGQPIGRIEWTSLNPTRSNLSWNRLSLRWPNNFRRGSGPRVVCRKSLFSSKGVCLGKMVFTRRNVNFALCDGVILLTLELPIETHKSCIKLKYREQKFII